LTERRSRSSSSFLLDYRNGDALKRD